MIFIILQYDLAAKKMVPRDESSCNLTITVSHDYDMMSCPKYVLTETDSVCHCCDKALCKSATNMKLALDLEVALDKEAYFSDIHCPSGLI